jgi:hypothetical protein
MVFYTPGQNSAGEPKFNESYRWRSARTLSVSRNSIDLLLGRPFEVGAAVSIVIMPYELPARVTRLTSQGEGQWLVGCEFLMPLREEQLRVLVD